MKLEVAGKTIEVDEQGYLQNPDDWSKTVAIALANRDKVDLSETHWGLIDYFREYYKENLRHPSMRQLVLTLGKRPGKQFHEEKSYEKFLYELFPTDPVRELCKLAGLPRTEPDT
jgi:tRNA 2-thiouridine synthesizing protein E